jgi:hypothetical protein
LITADMTWSAVCMRMCSRRRSQSRLDCTLAPIAGLGESGAKTCNTSPPSAFSESTILASPPSQRSTPLSPGWPPPVG